MISILKDDPVVRAVLGGPDGAIAAARPGAVVVDMSTVSPALARELAEEAGALGVGFLDAPVSGGDVGARAGTLSIMVGGEAADVEKARPAFEVLGSRVTHVGAAGAGQVAKACNQVMVAVIFAGLAEALVLGSKLGGDPAAILDALGGGMAGNRIMEVRRGNFLDHDFAPGFKVDLHHKDLEIALGAGGEVDAPSPHRRGPADVPPAPRDGLRRRGRLRPPPGGRAAREPPPRRRPARRSAGDWLNVLPRLSRKRFVDAGPSGATMAV